MKSTFKISSFGRTYNRFFATLSFVLAITSLTQAQGYWWTGGNSAGASSFIGTTNNCPLRFKVHNILSGSLNESTRNTYFGLGAGKTETGLHNTGIGYQSLYNNSSGTANAGLGYGALNANKDGSNNVAIGWAALNANTNGNSNIAIGHSALASNLLANFQIAIGTGALRLNDVGSNNTAIGSLAMNQNKSGSNNIAYGNGALKENVNGSFNTAIGFEALSRNLSGATNTATGYQSLTFNNEGESNSAFGSGALFYNTQGSFNTAVGRDALFENLQSFNTAVGFHAMNKNTIGSSNTAIGNEALSTNWDGSFNTAVGRSALSTNTRGNYNTAIGFAAYPPTGAEFSNYTGIGYNVGTFASMSNSVEVGNMFVESIKGQVDFGIYSDARIKEAIKADVPGLSFINRLRPVTYNLNIHKQSELVYGKEKPDTAEWEGKYDIEKIRMTGFIAQEVDQAAKETGYDFSGVERPRNANGLYSLRYAQLTVPLVKAVQEQQQQIEEQRTLIDEQHNALLEKNRQIENLEARLVRLESLLLGQGAVQTAQDRQMLITVPLKEIKIKCSPNPAMTKLNVTLTTVIAGDNNWISLFDATGKEVKKADLSAGASTVELLVGDLSVGLYTAALFVNGVSKASSTVAIAR
ncbi:MAG: tail fiber domain-containing protein [Saprospiraceae bacterium]